MKSPQAELVDQKLNHADLSLQQARTVAELAYAVSVQCRALEALVARLEQLEKKVKKSQKKADEAQK